MKSRAIKLNTGKPKLTPEEAYNWTYLVDHIRSKPRYSRHKEEVDSLLNIFVRHQRELFEMADNTKLHQVGMSPTVRQYMGGGDIRVSISFSTNEGWYDFAEKKVFDDLVASHGEEAPEDYDYYPSKAHTVINGKYKWWYQF
jgi:hypothetical protein